MLGIKKIDRYIIKSFITYFFMTFFICILILLMQFTWKYLKDLVGKGIDFTVFAEFFWYAALYTVPMALPLAILLAALMSFGNMGELFELTAMKSAGISLFRIMRGLIILISFISVTAFFFSNNVLPKVQTKLWTLLFSLKHKSPEFDIPEGEFYKGIDGYNIYVKHKDTKAGILKDVIIYDFSNGFENADVTLADTAKIQFTSDNKYLKLSLFSGESFANLSKQNNNEKNIPYRRETFASREVLLDFDTEFNRYDESIMDGQYVSKNLIQLKQTIDTVSRIVKAREREQAMEIINNQIDGIKRISTPYSSNDTTVTAKKTYNPDSLFLSLNKNQIEQATVLALQEAKSMKDKIEYNKAMLDEPSYDLRKHKIEWHKKFTLSFACLIFFFIGAPLGAIIRKGGLGMPIVISVLLFVVYYIIDNTGYKMAREGIWEVYLGQWLSSAVLFPLGLFLTWKAVTDANLFRVEAYNKLLERTKRFFTDKNMKFKEIFISKDTNL